MNKRSAVFCVAIVTLAFTPISLFGQSRPLSEAQCVLVRASRGVFVDALLALPQVGADGSVRRSVELLLGDAAKLAGKAKLDGTDLRTLPNVLEQLANKFEDTGVFDTNLAAQAELMFNDANAACEWGVPDFDSGSPQLPPGGGGGGGVPI